MSYPKKLSAEAIVDAALAFIEAHGADALSMRTLAADLDVAPNALYRYFPSKTELTLALSDAAGRILLDELQSATDGQDPLGALRATAHTYLRFARQRPALYAIKMAHCKDSKDNKDGPDRDPAPSSHAEVWALVLSLTTALPDRWSREDLAVALWAGLHGLVELDRTDMLEGRDPAQALDVMLDVVLTGLAASLAA